jgi:hypothetical protein
VGATTPRGVGERGGLSRRGAGKLTAVTVAETIIVFVGAPLVVVLFFAFLTLGPGVRNRRPRYKPGQAWTHSPVWYEPHPAATGGHGGGHGGETAGAPRPAQAGPLGGARGTW